MAMEVSAAAMVAAMAISMADLEAMAMEDSGRSSLAVLINLAPQQN